ncbi:MAG: hypothetical protein AAF446_02575 [Pseudomonadota bacterium]
MLKQYYMAVFKLMVVFGCITIILANNVIADVANEFDQANEFKELTWADLEVLPEFVPLEAIVKFLGEPDIRGFPSIESIRPTVLTAL